MLNTIRCIAFFFTILFVYPFYSCKKHQSPPPPDNPYGLPNATQTGQGTFGCRINGLNYTCTAANQGIYTTVKLINDTIYLHIDPKTYSYYEDFVFGVSKPVTNQTYTIGPQAVIFGYYTDSTCQGIRTRGIPTHSIAISGSITITKFDTIHLPKVVSGTFACDITIPDCDTLHVTDGRFDYGFPF